jgi:DNA-binding IclR family transcriptional regulator
MGTLSLIKPSKRLGLPKSMTMRLLMVPGAALFLRKERESGLYRVGRKLFELGNKAVAQFDWTERVRARD